MTEVTVIRFGGLDDKEEERKFRARNPVEIIQSVQRDSSKASQEPACGSKWKMVHDS
jgi:hypothetical protein